MSRKARKRGDMVGKPSAAPKEPEEHPQRLRHREDDLPEIPMLMLEAALIFGQELVEVLRQHAIEDSLLTQARAVHSRHTGKEGANIGPPSQTGPKEQIILRF
jgi:hypothetical protein